MTAQSATTPPLLAVVHGANGASTLPLLQRVVRTLPTGTPVVLATARPVILDRSLARTVTTQLVRDLDNVERLAHERAAQGCAVLVLRGPLALARGWHEGLLERLHASGTAVCELVDGEAAVTAFPPSASPLAARHRWPSAEGVRARTDVPQQRSGHGPTLSAVLIVKDEEERLGACLDSLVGLVDEVVVYDTGSSDATVQIARESGARTVEGYWDDDFAAARNRALEYASGTWVLSVDADEVYEGDHAALRSAIRATRHDGMPLTVVSVAWEGASDGDSSVVPRLFRRAGHRWASALHEQVIRLDGSPTDWSAEPAPGRLKHYGYTGTSIEERGKAQRNLAVSKADLRRTPAGAPERFHVVANYGRSLLMAGQQEEAVEALDEILAGDAPPSPVVMSARAIIRRLLSAGDLERAEAWIERNAASGESPGATAVFRAELLATQEQYDQAMDVLRPMLSGEAPTGRDLWGAPFREQDLLDVAARVELARGDVPAAAALLERCWRDWPEHVGFRRLVSVLKQRGDDLTDVVRRSSEEFLNRSLRELAAAPVEEALEWYEAFHAVHPADHRPVVAAYVAAPRMGWEAALRWTFAAREQGLVTMSALSSLALAGQAPAFDRCLAWALDRELGNVFSLDVQPLLGLLERVPADEVGTVLGLLDQHTPRTFRRLVEASERQPAGVTP